MAMMLVLSLAACGSNNGGSGDASLGGDTTQGEDAQEPAGGDEQTPEDTQPPAAADSADDIEDTMTSADGKYEVAFVTDVGQLKDKSFNQGTFDGVKLYANANGLSYKYYQPANANEATDDDRYDAMKAAVDSGATVVVCAGFMQEGALKRAASEFPDVKFIFIDGYPLSDEGGNNLTNVAPIAFKEEQCGYFAGYAVVKEGFTKLGFSGGGGGRDGRGCPRELQLAVWFHLLRLSRASDHGQRLVSERH